MSQEKNKNKDHEFEFLENVSMVNVPLPLLMILLKQSGAELNIVDMEEFKAEIQKGKQN